MEKFIDIPNASDKNLGFLSNDSKYGFFLKTDDDSYIFWQTVTHFIEAKKFEGTQYENEIRIAKTVMQVKHMTREREIMASAGKDNDCSVKKYGTKKIDFQIKQGWEGDLEKLLRIAIHAKFNQNHSLKEKLAVIEPKNIDYVSRIYPDDKIKFITAQLITELRRSYISQISPKLKSIPKPELSDTRICSIREVCMKISKHIAEMERWDRILPEMVEDAIFNICRNKKLFTRILSFQCENDRDYFLCTRKLFAQLDPFQSEIDAPTNKIVNFMLWCSDSEKKTQIIYDKILRFVDKINDHDNSVSLKKFDTLVVIPHSKRWYRDKSNIRMTPENKKNVV